MSDFVELMLKEAAKAKSLHGDYNSLHEGYAILLEEVDELWEIVRQKHKNRKLSELNEELIQIAACACKLHDLANTNPSKVCGKISE